MKGSFLSSQKKSEVERREGKRMDSSYCANEVSAGYQMEFFFEGVTKAAEFINSSSFAIGAFLDSFSPVMNFFCESCEVTFFARAMLIFLYSYSFHYCIRTIVCKKKCLANKATETAHTGTQILNCVIF